MKTRFNLYILGALLTVSASSADAAPLTPEAALSRASQSGILKANGGALQNARLVYTQSDSQSEAACYVFGMPGGNGFAVVSADDLTASLLGYSDEGSFDAANIPEPMKYWLESYADQIEWARGHESAARVNAVTRPRRTAIAPLVTTRWNQSSPYNDKCPQVNGYRCVTGCVATAMAQAMKYHNWPAQGEGSHSYTWRNSTLSMDFSTITFDWDNMLDTYGSDATAAQKDAVATLMNACGISVDMNYGTGASGAVQAKMTNGLSAYFGYSKGIYSAKREFYGLLDWEALIYNNLRDCGPVVYGGQSNDGGHSFICDGYSSDGYFHINWGWGGMSDGYFLLTALNPSSQGIGGSTSGYNFTQDAIIGIKKPGENDDYHYVMGAASDLTLGVTSATLGTWVRINTPTYNYSPVAFSGMLGMRIESLSDESVTYATGSSFENLEVYYGYRSYSFFLPSNLAEGEYNITPVFKKEDGEWQNVEYPVSCSRYMHMTVEGTTATFTEYGSPTVTVSEITQQTPIYIGARFYLTATISNPTEFEFLGEMTGVLISSDNVIVGVGDAYPIDLLGGESTEIEYLSEFKSFTSQSGAPAAGNAAPARALAAGNYKLAFVKGELGNNSSSDADSYTYLSDKLDVTVQDSPGAAVISVSNLRFADGRTTNVNPDKMDLVVDVKCTSGYDTNSLRLYIFPNVSGQVTSVGSLDSDPLFISAGETKEIHFRGVFSSGEPSKSYFCQIYNNGWVGNRVLFTLSDIPSGVEEVATDSEPVGTVIFTLDGVKVEESPESLAPGVYVVVTTYTDGKVKTAKLLKR